MIVAAKRQAEPMKWYEVTIKVAATCYEQTVTVRAADEWMARTEAMFACTAPLRGEHVEYDVREV
jgi:hypothetical protein